MSRQEEADAVNAYLAGKDDERYRREATLDANHIGKLERGEHRWPNDPRREAFRHVLQAATDAELGFWITRGMPLAAAAVPHVTSAADVSSVPPPDDLEDAETLAFPDRRRRALLKGVAAVATAAGLVGPRDLVTGRRIGTSDLARLNAVTAIYRSLDYECGGGMLYLHVNAFAESASSLVDCDYSDRLRPSLLASIAGARQLAGWTAFDVGRHTDAQRHWLSAERAAVEAGDRSLAARVRYCQARQFQHLRHNGDALDTLRLARGHLGSGSTPAISAMLYGAEAASLAALGDERRAVAALATAEDCFGRIDFDREPDWMRFYDRGELLAQYGRVYRDLARAANKHGPTAVRWVTEAIAAFGSENVRSTVLNEVGLCSALFLAGEPYQAIAVGARVIEHADQLTSRRVFDRIRNLRRDLTGHAEMSDVAEFGRRLAVVGRATPA